MPLIGPLRRHWAANQRLTGLLLAVWLIVSFGLTYFARELNFSLFGWPFSVWLASQGALIVYGLIIWFYARTMNRLDQQYGVAEEDLS